MMAIYQHNSGKVIILIGYKQFWWLFLSRRKTTTLLKIGYIWGKLLKKEPDLEKIVFIIHSDSRIHCLVCV